MLPIFAIIIVSTAGGCGFMINLAMIIDITMIEIITYGIIHTIICIISILIANCIINYIDTKFSKKNN